jgi:hypothetical protein
MSYQPLTFELTWRDVAGAWLFCIALSAAICVEQQPALQFSNP